MNASRSLVAASGCAVLLTVLLFAPFRWIDPAQAAAWATAIQTVAVIAALVATIVGVRVAAGTLASDRSDRRVDRVLALHQEFTTGEIGAARWRLANHLRANARSPRRVRIVKLKQLNPGRDTDGPGVLWRYGRGTVGIPRHDAALILRYFERVQIACEREAVDIHMLSRLLGRHAGWWDMAIRRSPASERKPLADLANKVNAFVESHGNQEFADWWLARRLDFPNHPRLLGP